MNYLIVTVCLFTLFTGCGPGHQQSSALQSKAAESSARLDDHHLSENTSRPPATVWGATGLPGLKLKSQLHIMTEVDTESDKIKVYNTGVNLELKHDSGFSVNASTTVDGLVEELESDDFKLDNFVKELYANYTFNAPDTAIVLSVGKMRVGTKTDRDSAREIGGYMGFRVSIQPKKVPLIQAWLTKNKWKVKSIEITRYRSASKSRLDFADLEETDMTAYAIRMSRSHNVHTFFIYKQPDGDSTAAKSITAGGVYSFENTRFDPTIFALANKTKSDHVDLNILIFSLGFYPFQHLDLSAANLDWMKDIKASWTESSAMEGLTGSRKDIHDFALKKCLYAENMKTCKSKEKSTLAIVIGGRVEDHNQKEDVVKGYLQLIGRF